MQTQNNDAQSLVWGGRDQSEDKRQDATLLQSLSDTSRWEQKLGEFILLDIKPKFIPSHFGSSI